MTDHYDFVLVFCAITNTRSRHEDTDYASLHLAKAYPVVPGYSRCRM
jgi:hypothetical protein